jgi:predicted dinucleotide-binding enzyme/ketosteroid isomerase-like protein
MKIGVIGTGPLGLGLGARWARAGHSLCYSHSRGGPRAVGRRASALPVPPGAASVCSIAEAARFGDVVLVAVPWVALPAVLAAAGPGLGGRTVLCATVRAEVRAGARTATTPQTSASAAAYLADGAPGAAVVFAAPLAFGAPPEARAAAPLPTVFLCGDAPAAKATVSLLLADAGFDTLDVGPLDAAPLLEPLVHLLRRLEVDAGLGPGLALRLQRPASVPPPRRSRRPTPPRRLVKARLKGCLMQSPSPASPMPLSPHPAAVADSSDARVRTALLAWACLAEGHATGDFTRYLALITDDYTFTMPLGEFRGVNVGRERAAACYAAISAARPRMRFHPPHHVSVSGDTVVLEWEDDGTLLGRPYHNRVAGSFDIRGDRVCGYREYLGDFDPAVIAALSEGAVDDGEGRRDGEV